MDKFKKVELSEYLGCDVVLDNCQYFGKNLLTLYSDALDKNIMLQYHQQDLMKYIEEQKKLAGTNNEETFEESNKKTTLKKYLFRVLFALSICACHVTSKNIKIQEISNVINSNLMLELLANDADLDGILEIDTTRLDEISRYSTPAADDFFYNTNVIYRLSDYVQLADNVSFSKAMDTLGYDIIEIDGVLYSVTGNVTKVEYDINGKHWLDITSLKLNDELARRYLKKTHGSEPANISVKTIDAKLLADIPTIKKSKKDDIFIKDEASKIKYLMFK